MSYFYLGLFLNVKRSLSVGVFGQLKTTDFVLFRTWPECCLVHRHLMRLSLSTFGLELSFRPFELKCMVFHLPARSRRVSRDILKLSFRINKFRLPSIDIGLLNYLER